MNWFRLLPTGYIEGYPSRVLRDRRREHDLLKAIFVVWLFPVLFGQVAWTCIDVYRRPGSLHSFYGWLCIVGFIISAPIFLLSVGATLWGLWSVCLEVARWKRNPESRLPGARFRGASIVPYFEKVVGIPWKDAPSGGQALARNSERLDALASQAGCPTLSDLGLDDDVTPPGLRWREAGEGLDVIEKLAFAVAEQPALVDSAADVLAELELVRQALVRARENGTRFCLLLSYSTDQRVKPPAARKHAGSFH